jgi:rubrerythrin
MKLLKGTRTAKNLLIAFSGEAQARNRYSFFASKAKNDGFIQIADLFLETAEQEKEHAKLLFKFMEGGDLEISSSFPFGRIEETEANLRASAAGEHHEYTEMYPAFAMVAEEEGFKEIALRMRHIAVAEQWHEARFLAFAENISKGRVFVREQPVKWRCRNCGYVHQGTGAPESCPACAHPKAYFELLHINA